MSYGIKLKVWGDYACFTRPEFKSERVSYEVITPTACIGILESIYWKPSMRWVIDAIHVYNPIKFENIMRNEISKKASVENAETVMSGGYCDLHQYIESERQQRNTMLLREVEYVIEAHFELVSNEPNAKLEKKHYAIFMNRARKGKCYQQPYLGNSEHIAFFELIKDEIPKSQLVGKKDLGWMLYKINHSTDKSPIFYRPIMQKGVIKVGKDGVG